MILKQELIYAYLYELLQIIDSRHVACVRKLEISAAELTNKTFHHMNTFI